jgi:hypothetical protein
MLYRPTSRCNFVHALTRHGVIKSEGSTLAIYYGKISSSYLSQLQPAYERMKHDYAKLLIVPVENSALHGGERMRWNHLARLLLNLET